MDAHALELFLRIVELGSLNRAASELHTSQPSVSRRLAEIEREVGTPLVIRTSQGVRPTDAGILLAERARPILRQLDILKDEIGQKAAARIAIAVPFSLRRAVTVPFVGEIAASQPHIRLRVFEGMNNQIRALMEDGSVDAAIVVSTERIPNGFEHKPLASEQVFLIGDKKAKLRRDTPVPLSRLGRADLILPARPNTIRAHLENAMRRAGATYRGTIEAETLALCLELTERGLGYTTLPASGLLGRLDGESGLTAAPIRDMRVVWTLCVNRARSHAIVVRQIAASLRAFVANQIQHGRWPHARLAEEAGRSSPSRRRPSASSTRKRPQ